MWTLVHHWQGLWVGPTSYGTTLVVSLHRPNASVDPLISELQTSPSLGRKQQVQWRVTGEFGAARVTTRVVDAASHAHFEGLGVGGKRRAMEHRGGRQHGAQQRLKDEARPRDGRGPALRGARTLNTGSHDGIVSKSMRL